MYLRHLFNILFLIAAVCPALAQDRFADAGQTRSAVERSLPFLEREGVTWMKEKACASCHHVPFLLWSHNEALARGLKVDPGKLAEWTDWCWKFSRTRREWFKLTAESLNDGPAGALPVEVKTRLKEIAGKPFSTEEELLDGLRGVLTPEQMDRHTEAIVKRAARPPEPENDGGGLDTLCQFLLGRPRGTRGVMADEFLVDTREMILRRQEPDGSWKAAGQLPSQARPAAETHAVTTMWAAFALLSLEKPDAATRAAVERAVEFLKQVKPGESNESLIGAMLVESKLGRKKSAGTLQAELLRRQNADGGWGWRQGGASDAFATGQAIYALCRSGLSAGNAAVERACRYLVGTQGEDGSWPVPASGISSARDPGRLARLTPIYRYWGTAWATIGLAQTLPAEKAQPSERKR